jgi:hypothetical protein
MPYALQNGVSCAVEQEGIFPESKEIRELESIGVDFALAFQLGIAECQQAKRCYHGGIIGGWKDMVAKSVEVGGTMVVFRGRKCTEMEKWPEVEIGRKDYREGYKNEKCITKHGLEKHVRY